MKLRHVIGILLILIVWLFAVATMGAGAMLIWKAVLQ